MTGLGFQEIAAKQRCLLLILLCCPGLLQRLARRRRKQARDSRPRSASSTPAEALLRLRQAQCTWLSTLLHGSSILTICAPCVTVLQITLGDADRSGGRTQGCKGL